MRRAGMYLSPMDFVKKTLMTAFYMSTALSLIIFILVFRKGMGGIVIPVYPILFVVLYFYMMRIPDAKIIRKEKEINKEIVFAGRFIVIEITSGVSLYDAMKNVSAHYEHVGAYFKEIIQKVEMGTSLDEALNQEVELIPSNDLKRVMWQIINSLRTGSDMATSLQTVLEQISREQFIEVKKYGRKLNPMAMFYMMMAVIIPSLGVTMLVILSSFIELDLGLPTLLVIAGFLGFIQFMFLNMIKFSRPAIDI